MPDKEQDLVAIQGAINEIQAGIQSDGGELELLSFENDIARVQLGGACARRHLTETLGRPIRVFPAWKD
jgi:Fe-S cluster biogenesis protein NfuA